MGGIISREQSSRDQRTQTRDVRTDLKLSNKEKEKMGKEELAAYKAYQKAADDLAAEQAKGDKADPAKIKGLTAAMNTQEKKYLTLHKARLETAKSTLGVQKTQGGTALGGGGVTTTQMDTTTDTTSAFGTSASGSST